MQSSSQSSGASAFHSGTSSASPAAFGIIENELSRVRALIEQLLHDCSETVQRLAEHIGAGRGKMIRPGLVLLSGLSCGGLTEEHIRTAAIIEMIHNATLLHDDVIDEGKSRRGQATVNSMAGNESAVLLGDFLLSRVFRMCVALDGEVAEVIASSASVTCEGELRQTVLRGNWELEEQEYIEIIGEKTAALFEGACAAGAMLADADDSQAQMLRDYGYNTGIAFQISDDLLDLVGDETRTGKTTGNDIDREKLTLPVIHLLNTASDTDKEAVKRILASSFSEGERSFFVDMLRTSGSIDYAQKRAQEFSDAALSVIAGLEDNEGKKALIELSRFIVKRSS